MKQDQASKLLNRYRKGQCTLEEKRKVEQWYASFEHKASLDSAQRATLERELLASLDLEISKKRSISLMPAFAWRVAAAVAIIAAGILLYTYTVSTGPQWVITETQPGEHRSVVLNDSTVVWMNAASRLRFPESFDAHERTVELLEGEAFFQVSHDKTRPFTITTPEGIQTRVLGTSFIISKYATEESIRVTVATGKVEVTSGDIREQLLPNQQFLYNKVNRLASVNHASAVADWVSNELVLNKVELGHAVQALSRAYGKHVTISDSSISRLTISGKFKLDQDPVSVLEVICTLHELTFTHKNDTLILIPSHMK